MHIVGKDRHFYSLNLSLDDVLKVCLSIIRAARICNFIILFEFVEVFIFLKIKVFSLIALQHFKILIPILKVW